MEIFWWRVCTTDAAGLRNMGMYALHACFCRLPDQSESTDVCRVDMVMAFGLILRRKAVDRVLLSCIINLFSYGTISWESMISSLHMDRRGNRQREHIPNRSTGNYPNGGKPSLSR